MTAEASHDGGLGRREPPQTGAELLAADDLFKWRSGWIWDACVRHVITPEASVPPWHVMPLSIARKRVGPNLVPIVGWWRTRTFPADPPQDEYLIALGHSPHRGLGWTHTLHVDMDWMEGLDDAIGFALRRAPDHDAVAHLFALEAPLD